MLLNVKAHSLIQCSRAAKVPPIQKLVKLSFYVGRDFTHKPKEGFTNI